MQTLKKTSLFWDVDLNDMDSEHHAEFIIKRILARGDMEDVRWMMEHYSKERVGQVFLNTTHTFDRKSLNFWSLYFNLDPKKCIPKSLMKKRSLFLRR